MYFTPLFFPSCFPDFAEITWNYRYISKRSLMSTATAARRLAFLLDLRIVQLEQQLKAR